MQEKAEGRFAIIGFTFLLYAIVLVAELWELNSAINDCNKALDNLGSGVTCSADFLWIKIKILIFGLVGLILIASELVEDNIQLTEYKDFPKREHKQKISTTESVEDAEGNQSIVRERSRRCRHWFPDDKRCDNYQVASFCEEHIKL